MSLISVITNKSLSSLILVLRGKEMQTYVQTSETCFPAKTSSALPPHHVVTMVTHLNISVSSPLNSAMMTGKPTQAGTRYSRAGWTQTPEFKQSNQHLTAF